MKTQKKQIIMVISFMVFSIFLNIIVLNMDLNSRTVYNTSELPSGFIAEDNIKEVAKI